MNVGDIRGELPPVLDFETLDGQDAASALSGARTWLDEMEMLTGQKPIIYTYRNFWLSLGQNTGWADGYPLFIGDYTPSQSPSIPDPWKDWTFWEYSEREKVAGIDKNVSGVRFHGSLQALYALAGLTAPEKPAEIQPPVLIDWTYPNPNGWITRTVDITDTGLSGGVFSQDGNLIAAPGGEKLRVIDFSSGKIVHEYELEAGSHLTSLAFSPASPEKEVLAAGYNTGTVILYSLSPGSPQAIVYKGARAITSLAFSPDGRFLAIGDEESKINLWDVRSSRSLGPALVAGQGAVRALAFSSGNGPGTLSTQQILASGGEDGTILLWDLARLQEGGTAAVQPTGLALKARSSAITSLAFHPADWFLASGSADGSLLLWTTDPRSWLQTACQIAGRNFTQTEWAQFFPGQTYRVTCEQYPAGPSDLPFMQAPPPPPPGGGGGGY